MKQILKRFPVPFDIFCFGLLMILSGFLDLILIVSYPLYRLPVFGIKLEGITGEWMKGIQPLIHFTSGYGALLGRRWAYILFMVYSAYGLINAIVNRLRLPPPHRIRTVFILGTLFVIGYLYKRRNQFKH